MALPVDPCELIDDTSDSRVLIAAERGGIVTRFDVGDEPILFMDIATLADSTKNVRGGIPVLFPSPGKLTEDAWTWGGHSGRLEQHGYARKSAWRIVPGSQQTGRVTLRLDGAQGLAEAWPWLCTVDLEYSLVVRTLWIESRITNHGGTAMPFGFGLHPYFHVAQADKANARVPTKATRAFDNITKQERALNGPIDLTHKEVDLHLIDHGASEAALVLSGRHIALRASPEFTRWVIWTLVDRDFVCLEPWTCPADALNTGEDLIVLAPGETRSLFVEIEVSQR